MSERLSQRVLEVGFGHMPAVEFRGSLFDDPSIQYIGIDVIASYASLYKVNDIRNKIPNADFLAASADALPLQDNSVDYVMMRSLFGQFTMDPKYWVSDINSIRDGGLFEAFRVLKPGGKIVILEENTPWESYRVESDLKGAGFSVNQLEFQKEPLDKLPDDDPWRKLKKIYFDWESTMGGPTRYWGTPYIMIGLKPENPEYEIDRREVVEKDSNGKSVIKIKTYTRGKENTDLPIAPQPRWR